MGIIQQVRLLKIPTTNSFIPQNSESLIYRFILNFKHKPNQKIQKKKKDA